MALHAGDGGAYLSLEEGADFFERPGKTRVGRGDGAHIPSQRHVRAERGRHGGNRVADAMVSIGRDDEAGTASMVAGDAQGEVIGFAARAGQHQAIGFGREMTQQLLGIGDDAFIEITRVYIEAGGLVGNRRDDTRVAMADAWHIVVGVEIGVAIRVIEADAVRPFEMDRFLIEHAIRLAENTLAALHQIARALVQLSRIRRIERVDHHRNIHGRHLRFTGCS